MRTCSYCGAEYADDLVECPIDHPPLVPEPVAPLPTQSTVRGPERALYEFVPLSPEERQLDWVTLVSCGTLVAADLAVSRLRADGIRAFIPDEHLMQAVGFNFNTFG